MTISIRRTASGPRSVAGLVQRLIAPVFRARGLAEVQVVTEWPAIAGEALARCSLPERLSFPAAARAGGMLRVRVESAMATELQHLEPQIVERINTYFGYRAVARLHLVQGPVRKAERAATPPMSRPDSTDEAAVARCVAVIEDEGLKVALTRLGLAILGAARGVSRGR